MSPRVIGLDISLTKTGVALPDGSTLLSSSAVRSIKGKKVDLRLLTLYDEIYALLGYHRVTHAIMEDLPVNGRGAGGTGQAQGVVRLALQQLDIPFVKVVASTLKKYATDNGRADKNDMWAALPLKQQALIRPVGTGWDDRTDAYWLWHMGVNKLDLGLLDPNGWRTPPDVVKWEGWDR